MLRCLLLPLHEARIRADKCFTQHLPIFAGRLLSFTPLQPLMTPWNSAYSVYLRYKLSWVVVHRILPSLVSWLFLKKYTDWSLLLVLFLVISSILLAVTNSGRLLLISLFNPFYQELNIFFRIDFISSPLLNFLRATTTLAYRTCCVRNNPDMQGSIHLYAEQYSVLWFLAPWIGIVELLEGFALRVLEIFCLAGDRRGIGEFRNSLGIWLLYWSQGLNFSSSLWKCTLLPFI